MKNPYSKQDFEEEVTMSPVALYGGIAIFLGLLVVPLIIVLGSVDAESLDRKKGVSLRKWLRQVDETITDAPLFQDWRRKDQAVLVSRFREGNSRVVIGGEGVLHYRPDIDAVIGKGPFYAEPPSVARAPGLRPWQNPLPVILEFSEQLRERGIELVVAPVPTKTMAVSFNGEDSKGVPGFLTELSEQLSDRGIRVVDLMPAFERAEPFLKQDTHWRSDVMQSAAELIAEELSLSEGPLRTTTHPIERSSEGDLVEMLDLPEVREIFSEEHETIHQVVDLETGELVVSDPESAFVLLGDSFVNIYEDPSLGFGEKNEEKIGAGLASHLAAKTGNRFHVIAINGDGASGVRKTFATLPVDVVEKKETVVWILSARDLLLAEIPGRRAGIRWEQVSFNTRSAPIEEKSKSLIVTGSLLDRSAIGNPRETTYDSAIYSVLVDQLELESGQYSNGEAYIFLWAFRDRELLPSSGLEISRRYRFVLKPFPSSGAASQATQLDDLFREDLPRYFAESFELVE